MVSLVKNCFAVALLETFVRNVERLISFHMFLFVSFLFIDLIKSYCGSAPSFGSLNKSQEERGREKKTSFLFLN